MVLWALVADNLLAVHQALHFSAVVAVLLRLMKNWIGSRLRQIRWVRLLLLRVVGSQEFVVEAFGQIVLGPHWLVVVVHPVVVVGLAGLVEVVALAHLEGEYLAWTAYVGRRSVVHCSVPVAVLLAIP